MVRKRIRRISLGGAVIFIVLFCTLDANGQFGGEAITYTISGSTGVSGVTMAGLPGEGGQTVVTDQNGYYNAMVKYGWGGTVKPVKEGYTFEPDSKSYQRVTADMANEDYTPTPITYTITGKVTGAEGVELRGLPSNPITGPDGSYSVTVPYGWAEMVTPTKEGYTFTPSNKGYPPVKSNLVQNYAAEAVKLLITGSAGAEGVTMKGLPNNPVTGANGIFSVNVDYGWTGIVTPEKEGYEFEPVSLQYNNIVTSQTNDNFTAKVLTYTISGTAGMSGVQMKGLPGDPYTDENGYFVATVPYGFSNTVTPVKDGYKFDPATLMLAKVDRDGASYTFNAEIIKLTISGTTGLPGVEMNGLPDNPITGANGSYTVTVDFGWNGTVTPMKEGYTFTPVNRPYPSVTANMTNQTYNGTLITYTISGTTQVSGVTIKGLPGGRTVVSNPSGAYTATAEYGWTGTLTPMKEGYEFQPPSIPFDSVMANQSGQDFMPTLLQRKISGTIMDAQRQPVAGVNIVADNNGGQTVTGAAGQFELSVGHGWGGKLTPLKQGYTFRPTNKPYTSVSADQLNQAFTATVEMFDVSGEVVLGGVPIDGVLITASDGSGPPITATTDLKGKYSLKLPYGWTGELTPTKEGIRFNPPSQSLINVTTNMVNGQPVPVAPPREVIRPTPPREVVVPGPTPPREVVVPGPTPPREVVVPGPTPPDVVTPETDMERQMRELEAKLDELMRKPGAGGPSRIPTGTGPRDPGTVLITETWLDHDLVMDVLPAIAEQAGITIIPDEVVAAVGSLVTANLVNTPLDQALEIVLAPTNFVVKKTPYYWLVASADMKDGKFPVVSETRHVTLNYVTAEAAVTLLSTVFKPYVQSELARPGAETFTVVVTAPPVMLNRILEDLKKIDKEPPHVLLDARIVVMDRGNLLNLGVEWRWPKVNVGAFSSDHFGRGDPLLDFSGESPWGIQMGYSPDAMFTNALELSLNLLSQNGEATVLSKPQVVAQDGKQAQMTVMTEEYYMLTAPLQATNLFNRTELAQIESGTKLTITPHVGENNDITLRISVEVSDSIPAGTVSALPVITRRTADNTVTVQDGGTVALAGLTENRTRTDKRRAPVLSNLPLLGGLFKNTNDQQASREIAVFVTAHIMKKSQFEPPKPAPPSIGQNFGQPPTSQSFGVPSEVESFGQPSVDQGFNRSLVDQDFNRPSPDRSFDQPSQGQRFDQPFRGPAPVQPMGDDFRSSLRESLLRSQTR